MKKIFGVIVSFMVISLNAQVQDSLVYWGTRELSWNDFGGEPEEQGTVVAMSYIAMGYRTIEINADSISLDVYCFFDNNHSWVKLKTPELLKHEQKHFDIGEIYMRILRYRILNEKFTYQNVNIKLKLLRDEAQMGFNVYSDQYDKETNRSENIVKQKEWEAKIDKELADLAAYSNRVVKIKVYR